MKRIFTLIALFVLTGCARSTPVTMDDAASSSSVVSEASSSVDASQWKTYHDAYLHITLKQPATYTVSPATPDAPNPYHGEWGMQDYQIPFDGIRIGDDMPEGNGVHIYMTKDKRILDAVQQEKPFTGRKEVNGLTYDRYEYVGMGDVYGYVAKRGDTYVVFESMWGPENPVSEKMLQSLTFDN